MPTHLIATMCACSSDNGGEDRHRSIIPLTEVSLPIGSFDSG